MSKIPRWGSWSGAGQTQAANTAIYVGIPPHRGIDIAPLMYTVDGNSHVNWFGQPVTKVTYAGITSGSTAHTWYFLRPKNYTTIAEAVTLNDTTIVMTANPGLYATTYKYPLPPGVAGVPGVVADNTPASGDYVAFQLDNGGWHFSLVSSLSTLTLTIATGTPNVAGSTAAVGNVLFFFGAAADKDPSTGLIDPAIIPAVSAFTAFYAADGIAAALRAGDPLILLNGNATAASTLGALAGVYDKY